MFDIHNFGFSLERSFDVEGELFAAYVLCLERSYWSVTNFNYITEF